MLHLYYQTDAAARHTPGTLIGGLINLPKLGRDRIEVGRLPRCHNLATACVVIAGIEAVQMSRKGQVLGISKKNLHGQAWVFGSLLGLN